MRAYFSGSIPLFGALLFGSSAVGACSSSSSAGPNDETADAGDRGDAEATATVELLSAVDLPRQANTRSLSGTVYDAATRTLFAIIDKSPKIVPLTASDDFTSFTVGTPITVTGRPTTTWDGEGLARLGDDFFAVTHETTPLLERFDADGVFKEKVPLPAHFAKQHPGNKGIESLGIDPSGGYLFVANEAALTTDGDLPTKTAGSVIRIFRREIATGTEREIAYQTEPLGAGSAAGSDMGVSDLLALDRDNLLILERGYQSDYGNTVRIFRIHFEGSGDVHDLESTVGAQTTEKTLLVDLSTLPSSGVTHPGLEPNPLLDNYEGLGLGPTLSDGRTVIFVTSDDNGSDTQVARILVLAVRL